MRVNPVAWTRRRAGPYARDVPLQLTTLVAALALTFAAVPQPGRFAIHQVGEHVTVLEARGIGRANSVLITGREAALLVDAQISPSAGRALVTAVGGLTPLPVRFLVLTHWHVDHAHGAAGVVDALPNVTVLAHPRSIAALDRDGTAQLGRARPFWAQQSQEAAARLSAGAADPDGTLAAMAGDRVVLAELADPRWVVPVAVERRDIDLGGLTVSIRPASGHTDGDLIVYLPSERIVVAGDVPLDRIRAREDLDADRIVPGHGLAVRR